MDQETIVNLSKDFSKQWQHQSESHHAKYLIHQQHMLSRHTSYYHALIIFMHQFSLCLTCVNGSIFVTMCEVHVPNLNPVLFSGSVEKHVFYKIGQNLIIFRLCRSYTPKIEVFHS